MYKVVDLHLHSKYSRAVSRDMTLPLLDKWGTKKGIDILSTADWTHPLWFREIRQQLIETSEGLYSLKDQTGSKKTLFLLSVEISSIYSQNGKVRRMHNLLFVPSFEIAQKVNKSLIAQGCNLMSDGRPIIGLSSKNLLELVLSIDKEIMLIPCHVWTPHFGLYGSASGFNSIQECFGNLSSYVFGIETGLSSDPWMNWQIKELNTRSILSFSDAHSLPKIGRELTVFDIERKTPKYSDIINAIKRYDNKVSKIAYTIEFYPEEGKYHFSGHRNCKIVRGPEEISSLGNMCPVCKKRLTEGVLYRIEQLSNGFKNSNQKVSPTGIKWFLDPKKNHPPFIKLVPLNEIIAENLNVTPLSEKVKRTYERLCSHFGSELEIMLKTPIKDIESFDSIGLGQSLSKVRQGDIFIQPGFDGEYGKVKIWNKDDKKTNTNTGKTDNQTQLGLEL